MSTAGHIHWKIDPHARFRRLFDEAVVIHQDLAEALVLNDTGAAFLELCDGSHSFDETIELLTRQFEVSAEQLTTDLQPFIDELVAGVIISPLAGAEE